MNIKNIALTASVAFVSAFGAVGTFNYLGWNKQQVAIVEPSTSARLAAYSPSGVNQPIDLRYAAATSTPSVVHIKSTIKAEKVSSRGKDPFADMFGNDFYKYFQGGNPYRQGPQIGTGSGVVVSSDGYIVTNNHVIDNADEIEVMMSNNKTYKAKVIGKDADTDIALVKIEATDLAAINFANSDSVLIGEWVMAVGNPFNLETTVTAGIVSAKGRNISLLDGGNNSQNSSAIESFIQTDAAVNPGNSGGALVNVSGELVGINTAIASPTGSYAGYSFAVPSNIVKKVIFDLQKFGVSQRGFLGVIIRTMDDKTAKELGFDRPYGVYLDGVNKGSAAEVAGLKTKDVVTKINGIAVNSSPELQEQVAAHRPGDKLQIEYIREGKTATTQLVLKNKYNTISQIDNSKDVLTILGIKVENLTTQELRSMGLQGGVKITELKDGKLTEFTDIRKGFIITQIDDEPVTNVTDFTNLLKEKNGKVLVEGMYPNKPMSYLYAFRL